MLSRYAPTALLLAILVSSGTAQELRPTTSSDAARSAAALALNRAGLERSSGGTVVARALHVRLRTRAAGRDLLTQVRDLARRAGLEPAATTPLSFARPLDERERVSLLSISPERRERVLQNAAVLERTVELHYAAELPADVAARHLSALPEVELAEPIPMPSLLGTVSLPSDPRAAEQSHLERIGVFEAWDIWKGDTNTVVGIVDAGVDMFHEDIAPNIAENAGETGRDGQGRDKRTNGVDDDDNGAIDDWLGAYLSAPDDNSTPGNTKGSIHGTPVAGGAAAATNNGIGVSAPALRCRVFPIKAQRSDRPVLTKGYEGIEYCGRRGFKVVNCSWGDPRYSRTTEAFIAYVIARYDIAIVAAGGNNILEEILYPAGYRGVLGVGALDATDVFNTTWGGHIDVSAPVGLMPTEDNGYFPSPAATSFSAPVAAGVLTLLRSRWPSLTAEQSIEHLRRTADTLPAIVGKEYLTGVGRVNALRAVSVDPFSSPAILLDTLWLTDMVGAPKASFAVFERGTIVLRLRNVLGSATGIRVRVVPYGANATTIVVDTSWISLPALATGAGHVVTPGIAFQQLGADTNRIGLRIEITADGGYRDNRFEAPFFFRDLPAFLIYSTPELLFSVSHRANLGYTDYPANEFGIGVNFRGENYLFEGGFIAASSEDRVVSNIRGSNPDVQDKDFAIVVAPGPVNDSTGTLSDAGAPPERRVGITMLLRTIVDGAVPAGMALETVVLNDRFEVLDSLAFGLFCDWDLAGDGSAQNVAYRTGAGARVPFHALVWKNGAAVASGVLAAPSLRPIFFAIDNGGAPVNIYQGFEPWKKWRVVSSGVGNESAANTDVSVVTGRTFGPLAPGAGERVVFVIGFGADTAAAVSAMLDIASRATAVVESPVFLDGVVLGSPHPSPAGRTATVLASAPRGSTLTLHDALGRAVLDLSDQLAAEPTWITIDLGGLAAGAYLLRLQTPSGSRTVKVLR